jgi:hypothetical protein
MVSARWRRWLVVPALLLFYTLALNSLLGDSPTMDEQNHIARGFAYLRTGDPRLSVEHPPLVNALSAAPLLVMPELELPLDDPSWERQPADVFWYVFAEKFVWETNRQLDVQQIYFLARLPIVYLTIGLALVGWHFAREMWGYTASVLVFLLLLFDPNILANGRYSTTDLGGTLFALLATYMLWRLWQAQGWHWQRWFWAALAIGLAFSSKLSTLVFVPIWGVLALLPLFGGGRANSFNAAVQRLVQLTAAGLAALFILWALYRFEWGHFLFLDQRLAGLNSLGGPMPTFWSGIERILLLSGGGRPGFLLGQFSNEGFPLYFPVILMTKTPLLTLVMLLVATILLLALRKTRRSAVFLLVPLILYFAMSMFSALNLGYRHLLPLLPFVYLLIGGVASRPVRAWAWHYFVSPSDEQAGESIAPAIPVVLVLLGLVIIDIWIHPHYLSYFNLIAGGPANGQRIAVDSNVDWGQDLLRLQGWMADNEIDQVKLGWFGTADPDYYGLNYEAMPGFPRSPFISQWTDPPFNTTAPEPGVYAISASSLWELPLAEKNVYPWFREREPDDRIGYSILIYEVP